MSQAIQSASNGHLDLDGYDINSSYQYGDQAFANSQAAIPTYTQGESDFINVRGRIFEDPNPQPGDADYGGDWTAPYPEHHYDEQDENVAPSGLPSPGYHDFVHDEYGAHFQ
jgi:hypothetical protein